MELRVPVPFDLDEEIVFLEKGGNMRHEPVRQILFGEGNAHIAWISQKFFCRCRLVDTDTHSGSNIAGVGCPPTSVTSKQPSFILDRGTEANLKNAKIAVNALINAAIELIDTLQATENRVQELSNDANFIRWYEAEREPESQESRKAIVAQLCNTLLEEEAAQDGA